ncbi:MAG: universal stress protein [bacterium]
MIKSILLSVDGSVYTDAQVKHAIDLAKACQARLKVISIVDVRIFEWAVVMGTDGFVPVIPSNVYKEETKRILEDKASAILEKCQSILLEAGIEFETEKIYGAPVDVILEKSRLVDMLIIGARGEFAKWKKNMVGATLDAVMRQWNKPLLITPQKFRKMSKIIFAYDGSDRSNKALQLAGFFATQLEAGLSVLTVHDKPSMRQKFLNEARAYLEPYHVAFDLTGVAGHPEKEIVQVADETGCDLIIMGAFGHSRIREAILGSTTEQVIRNANIPVLLSK